MNNAVKIVALSGMWIFALTTLVLYGFGPALIMGVVSALLTPLILAA